MRGTIVTFFLAFVLKVGSENPIDSWSDFLIDNLFDTALKGWTLHNGNRALPIVPRVAHRYSGVDGVAPLAPQRPELVDKFTRARPRITSVQAATIALAPGEGRAGSGTPSELNDNICLVPGDPIVRIEKAPSNAVRIFTGIDVVAPMQNVWDVLTDYENLGKVVPSIVRNEVVKRFESGARLAQSASAKVLPGLSFSAKMVLDVQLYQDGIPESQTAPCVVRGTSADVRKFDSTLPLVRGIFPRPYAVTSLPHKDITMANVKELPGDFEHYQGVWRVQSLPGCAPEGGEAARLTYAVEIKPKGFLPVNLIENRIASDLKQNLQAIRSYVESKYNRAADLARRSPKPVETDLPVAGGDSSYSASAVGPDLPVAGVESSYSASAKPTLTTNQQLRGRETRARWFRPKMKKLLTATRAYFQTKLA